MSEQYFADDRVIIPEYIRKMTSEERKAEIARIEEEDRKKRVFEAGEKIGNSSVKELTPFDTDLTPNSVLI